MENNEDQAQNNLFFFQEQPQPISNEVIQKFPLKNDDMNKSSYTKTQKSKFLNRQQNINHAIGRNIMNSDNNDDWDYLESVTIQQNKNKKNINKQKKVLKQNQEDNKKYSINQENPDIQIYQQDENKIIQIKLGSEKKKPVINQKSEKQQIVQNIFEKVQNQIEEKQIQKPLKKKKQFKYKKQPEKKEIGNQIQKNEQSKQKQSQILKKKQQNEKPLQKNLQNSQNIKDSDPDISKINHQMTINISQTQNRKKFLTNPIPKGTVLQCSIKRDKSGFGRFFPHYDLYVSDGLKYLMSAKRKAGNTTSNYVISIDKNDMQSKGPNYIGKVRSNFVGTEFYVYDDGYNPQKIQYGLKPRKILAQIYYQSNFFGSKGPRKMTTYIPNVQSYQSQSHFSLKQLYETNSNESLLLINKPPRWNQQMKAYVLNFNGRVDKPSVKNFILINQKQQDTNLLLFGRIGQDVFNIDIQYPLTPLQAFGIVLSSFDYKIACE